MQNVLLSIITLSVFAVAVFVISFILEAKKTVMSLRKTTEDKLIPVLEELTITLRNIKNISENVNMVTEDVRTLSRSLGEAGQTISSVKGIIDAARLSTSVRVASFAAGLKVAILYFITHLFRKGE